MIGEILKQLRDSRGLTLKQMGEYLGVSHMTYQRYEKNDCDVSTEMLSKLADFYGVTTDYLLGREPEPDPLAMLNIKVDNKKFIDIYQELPEFQQRFLVDAMRKLSASAEANVPPRQSREQKQPRPYIETTPGAIEDDKASAPEEDAGA